MGARVWYSIMLVAISLLLNDCATSANLPPPLPQAGRPAGTSGELPSIDRTAAAPPSAPAARQADEPPPRIETVEPPLERGSTPTAAGPPLRTATPAISPTEFKRTFNDVLSLIQRLNEIIASRDYAAWTTHLTADYEETFSDPKILAGLSAHPLLQREGITLTTLRDYFLFVVVPSRAAARLDDIEFVNKTTVKAITVIDGRRYILYTLVQEQDGWKIGLS